MVIYSEMVGPSATDVTFLWSILSDMLNEVMNLRKAHARPGVKGIKN